MNAQDNASTSVGDSTASIGWRRELVWLGVWLAVGLLLLPALIWVAGRISLGDYVNGGPFALWKDLLAELGRGSLVHWIVILGPYVLVSGARIGVALVRRVS